MMSPANFRLPIFLLACAFAGSSAAQAETISAKRIAATIRLIPLKKITVGPDDQYHGTIDPTGQTLVFTRKSDLVPHLCRQDMKSGDVTDLMPLTADSQDPAMSPDGRVAFTYYKFNARGDICYRDLKGKPDDTITCLKANEGEQSAPFWRSANEIGYLLRDTTTLNSKIIAENISTGHKEVLAEGKVWSPTMKPGGRYLVYNQLSDAGSGVARILVLKDLATGKSKALRFSLPGISGFPAVSDDESTLFFSHYLDDTNHDNVIDGNDNSVVFRASIESLMKGDGETFPEQLTSVENNCSFPRPHQDQLFVTCAFEGALDVYQLPVTGVVPVKWDERNLMNAQQTSRTYQERILILNTLKFRVKSRDNRQLEELLLSDHLLADDTTASKYYLKKLQTEAPDDKRNFYGLLNLYLDALEKKKSQPSEAEVSSQFQADILALDAQVVRAPGPARFKKIIQGLFRTFLNQPQPSAAFLKLVRFDSPAQPQEREYFFELASWTLPRIQSPGSALSDVYRQMMGAPELSEESQIYYAFRFLQYLQVQNLSHPARIEAIDRVSTGLPAPVTSLLKSEALTLKIIDAPSEDGKAAAYRELDQYMSASRSDYFLRKALYVRSILNFADAAEFKYLNFIATNWIRYTTNDDTEFAHAREVYANATLDQAYDSLAKKSYKLADNYFYGSLSLTDDLESHSGFIRTLVLENDRPGVDESYKNLQKRQFIDDNMKFVDALLVLIDARPKSRDDVKHLDTAIEKLKTMEQDRDSPVRYLLLGACYLDKLQRLSQGYDFDRETFEAAHRNLMLAYDLGRDNARIKASALMDLGLLHQRVQNHGLAAKFFAKRKDLGFISDEDSARFAWFYGQSLFYSNQPDKAADELGRVVNPKNYSGPLLDRWAFYLQAAGKYESATQAYQKLFQSGFLKGDLNLAKAYLGYGFSLFKLKRETEARTALNQSLDHASHLQILPKDQDRLMDFLPVRLQLDAFGLLAQTGTKAERLDALEKRGDLLTAAKVADNTELFDDGLSLLIQNRLQIAKLDPARSARMIQDSLRLAEKLGDSGQYLSHAVYQVAVDSLENGILHPEFSSPAESASIRKLVDKSIHAYEAQRNAQPVLEHQKLKLQILWTAYSSKVLKTANGAQELQKLLAASPEHALELKPLATALASITSQP